MTSSLSNTIVRLLCMKLRSLLLVLSPPTFKALRNVCHCPNHRIPYNVDKKGLEVLKQGSSTCTVVVIHGKTSMMATHHVMQLGIPATRSADTIYSPQ